jgi:hypothetical protein
MRLLAVLLCGFCGAVSAAPAESELARVKTVYLLPMANGLDHYLANRITNSGVFKVVTDPKRADAVFTDRIGTALEDRLEELFPPAPAQEAAAQPDTTTENKSDEQAPSDARPAKQSVREAPAVRFGSFSRAKGTLFLVDPHSREVLWSTYDRSETSAPQDLDRMAERVVHRVRKEVRRK